MKNWERGAQGLGERIGRAVKKVGGQAVLAKKIGVNEATIRRYRTGGDPKLSVLIAIAEATETPLSVLIFGETGNAAPDKVIWNVAYFLCDKADGINVDPELFADTFVDLVAYLGENSGEDASEKVIDFAARKLARVQGSGRSAV